MRAAFLLPLLAVLTACNAPITRTPQPTSEEIAAEEKAQQRMVDEVTAEGGKPRPWRSRPGMRKQYDTVAGDIETAGAKICKAMGLPKHGMRCYYYFHMDSLDKEINAHTDGKRITVAGGMMRFIENDDELALILGHELAHSLMAHVAAKENNAYAAALFGAFLAELAGENSATRKREFENEMGLAGALTNSHGFEYEADYIGLYIMAEAGYDVNKAIHFWRRLSVEEPQGIYPPNFVESAIYLNTHPSNAERFAVLQKTVAEINTKRKNRQPLVPNF